MAIGDRGRVNLRFLETLGVSAPDVDELRKALDQADTSASQMEKVDVYGRVAISDLSVYQKKFGLPVGKLKQILTPPKNPPTELTSADSDYPKCSVRLGEPRSYAENMGPQSVKPSDLPHSAQIRDLVEAREFNPPVDFQNAGMDVEQLATLLTKSPGSTRIHLTGQGLEDVTTRLHSMRGPAYTERDAHINFDSKLELIAEGKGNAEGVRVHKKSMYEYFFLRRKDDGKSFDLHGFRAQRLAVEVPPGHSVFIVDSEGNHRDVTRRTTKSKLDDGSEISAYDISQSMIQSKDRNGINTHFTVKVLDKEKTPVFEENFRFDPKVGQRSEKLFSGEFGVTEKPATGEGELTDIHFNQFVPNPAKNKAPVGERPQFDVTGNGNKADQLLVERDGKSFAVNRLCQFGHPPKATMQSFKASGQRFTLGYQGTNASHLDDPEYDPTAGFKIRSSNGFGCTFDRDLNQSAQVRWSFRGVDVWGGSVKGVANFDPLEPVKPKKS